MIRSEQSRAGLDHAAEDRLGLAQPALLLQEVRAIVFDAPPNGVVRIRLGALTDFVEQAARLFEPAAFAPRDDEPHRGSDRTR